MKKQMVAQLERVLDALIKEEFGAQEFAAEENTLNAKAKFLSRLYRDGIIHSAKRGASFGRFLGIHGAVRFAVIAGGARLAIIVGGITYVILFSES